MKEKRSVDLFSLFYKNSLLVETIIIFLVFGLLTQGAFLQVGNLSNLLMQGATCSIIAITMCMIIITGNADLSAGRFLGMLCMVAAILQVTKPEIPSWVVLVCNRYCRRAVAWSVGRVSEASGVHRNFGHTACVPGN